MAGLVSATRLFLAHYGLLALFVLLVLEEAGLWLPLPGDLLIAYFGAQLAFASNPLLAALPMLLVITAGVLVGSLLLYVLVRRFRWVIHRFGRFIQLDEARLAGLEVWF